MSDPDMEVRRALLWSQALRQVADEEWLLDQAGSDAQFACDLAREVGDFTRIEPHSLLRELAGFSDPAVRAAVAEHRAVGRSTLEALSADPDPEVRLRARDTLNG